LEDRKNHPEDEPDRRAYDPTLGDVLAREHSDDPAEDTPDTGAPITRGK
jgi:hypothetical protein